MNDYLEGIADLGSLAETKTLIFKYKKYQLVHIDCSPNDMLRNPGDKEWYLVARGIPEKYGDIEYSNPSILISIINLAMKIDENNGLKDELAFSDEVSEWCHKYGHPFEELSLREDYYVGTDGNPRLIKEYTGQIEELPKSRCHGFRVREFKRRILVLYDHFQLWHGLTFDDFKKVIKFSHFNFDFNKDLDEQIIKLKGYLARRVYNQANARIGLQYNEKNDSYTIIPITRDLISVAYFQLAMLMTNKGLKGVKFCSMCNKLFEINHGGTKICDDCKPEYHKIKTQESRMKNGTKKEKELKH